MGVGGYGVIFFWGGVEGWGGVRMRMGVGVGVRVRVNEWDGGLVCGV